MFKGNVLEYGGTRIEYDPSARTFLFRSFIETNGKVELLEHGKFRIFDPYTTVMSNGSHKGIREIMVINDKIWGGSVKVRFAILPDDFQVEDISKIIKALVNKAKSNL